MSQPPRPPEHGNPDDAQGPQYPQYGQQYGQHPQYGQPYDQPYGQPYGEQYGHPHGEPFGPPPGQAAPGLRLQLGARTRVRPEPRFGVSLAGAGAALVIAGGLVWSIGYLIEGLFRGFGDGSPDGPDTSRRFLGFAVFGVLLLAGYALAVARRDGPLATAGAVLGAFSLPLALLFVTVSASSTPFNVDAVYLVSILGWLASYLLVRGMRGRTFLLGLVALGVPGYIGFKVAGDDVTRSALGSVSGGPIDTPDTSAPGYVALVFGLLYVAVAFAAERKGRPGVATAFVVAALLLLLSGVSGLADEFGATGTGVLLLALGLVLARYGAWAGRRVTTWTGALALVAGVVVIVADAASDSYVAGGVTLMLVGAAVVVLAAAAGHTLREAPDLPEDLDHSPGSPGPDGWGHDHAASGGVPQP
ncbi:hypothetical protein [Jatrophihabitans fulvus]